MYLLTGGLNPFIVSVSDGDKQIFLNPSNPKDQGYVEATIKSVERHGFKVVESTTFPGYAFKCKCVKCGHELKINQLIYRVRHQLKCELK